MSTTKRNDIAFRAAKERREDRYVSDASRDESRLIRMCKEADAEVEQAEEVEDAASDVFYANTDDAIDAELEAAYAAAKEIASNARKHSADCYLMLSQWRRA